jgi:hypothetical protein
MTDAKGFRQTGIARLVKIEALDRSHFDHRLLRLFDTLNDHHFDGVLPLVMVSRNMPHDVVNGGDLNGNTRLQFLGPPDTAPALATISISNWHFETACASAEVRWTMIAATLLHEMAHLAVHLDALGGRHDFDPGHGQMFTDECNRIGRAMEWEEAHPDSDSEFCEEYELSAVWPGDDFSNLDANCTTVAASLAQLPSD